MPGRLAGTAVVFGAGNVGRGLLGQVFSQAGLEVVFADIDDTVVGALESERSYLHLTVDNDSRIEQVIAPVRAIRADDPAVVREALATATLAATCVGVRALPAVCRAIAPALLARIESGAPPLNLLLAENLHEAPARVRAMLEAAEPTLSAHFDAGEAGLIATSIGRMIPAPRPEVSRLGAAAIEVEPYCFLPIDAQALRGDFPAIPRVVADASVPFDYYADRKLFVHNMGHAMCAYLGRLCGDEQIWQSIGRPQVRLLVRNAMVESACAVAAAYGQPIGPLLDHVDDLLYRFGNQALGDTVERVGRDPRRKLAAGDRMLGAHGLCLAQGIDPRHVRLALAAGLTQLINEESLGPDAADAFLTEQGMADPVERALVAEYCAALRDGLDPLITLLDRGFAGANIP
ncbi:MAG: mannitol-1-phosphate 5-dehydrogenase [Actinobacteria bacterium]|nr:mannitol-1-phosphate 5-dehydrogenase [Actinomycetota bacterium]